MRWMLVVCIGVLIVWMGFSIPGLAQGFWKYGSSGNAFPEWDVSVTWGGVRKLNLTVEEQAKLLSEVKQSTTVSSFQVLSWGKEGEQSLIIQVTDKAKLLSLVQRLIAAVPRAAVDVRHPLSPVHGVECKALHDLNGYHRCVAADE